jgi:hypothetical protein
MKEMRWLLPFTFGVNMRAIDLVLCMAERSGATLVTVSLLVIPDLPQGQGPRLEYIQQSKDFLEAVRWKATRYRVLVEPHEVWTVAIHERIKRLVLDLHCDSIILVTSSREAVLLDAQEMKRLLMSSMPASLVLVRMPEPKQSAIARLVVQVFSRIRKCLGQRSTIMQTQAVSGEQGLL